MNVIEYIQLLTQEGRHEEAQKIAQELAAFYHEDASGDGTHDDGTCYDCGYVFTEADCQHGEFEPHVLCDSCYRDRGGR